jgi:hypothetical protein
MANTHFRINKETGKKEYEYLHGWLQANPGSKDFKPTTGGNSVWASTKAEAIRKVNQRCKESEKKYPTHYPLRIDPNNCYRAKSYKESNSHSYGLYLMTI